MNVLCVSPELNGIGKESGVGTFFAHISDLLSSRGEQIKLLYSGAGSTDDLDPTWNAWYNQRGIEILRLQKHPWHEVPSHYTYMNIPAARCAEAVAASIPNDIDVVYFLQQSANGFHAVRQARFTQGRRPVLVTILDGGSPWHRANHYTFPQARRGGHELNDDMLELYAAEHSDYVVSADRSTVEWLSQQGWPAAVTTRVRVLGYPLVQESPSILHPSPMDEQLRHLVCLCQIEDKAGVELFVRALDTVAHDSDRDLRDIEQIVFLNHGDGAGELDPTSQESLRQLGLASTVQTCETTAALRQALQAYVQDGLVVVPKLPECFPYSVLESACIPGLRVLYPRGGRTSGLLGKQESSCLFDPYPLPLAQSIAGWLHDSDRDTQPVGIFEPDVANEAWVRAHDEISQEAARRQSTHRSVQVPSVQRDPDLKSLDIFVPYFNKQQYLPQLLMSLEQQTSSDFTVHVVDDGSTHPEAQAVFKSMQAKYESRGWQFVSQANRYAGGARNTAAKLGTAEYICFVDSDDVVAPQMVERLIDAIRVSQDDCVGCYYLLFEGDEFPYSLESGAVESRIVGRLPLLGEGIATGMVFNFMGGCCSIIRRSVFEELGGYREDRNVPFEDWEFHVRLLLSGYRLDIVPEYLYYYRQHPNSLLHAGSVATEYDGYVRVQQTYDERLRPLGLGGVPAAVMGMYQQMDALWIQEDQRNQYIDELHHQIAIRNRQMDDLKKRLNQSNHNADELGQQLSERARHAEDLEKQTTSTQKQLSEATRQIQQLQQYADRCTVYESERAALQSSLAYMTVSRVIWPLSRTLVPGSARRWVKHGLTRTRAMVRQYSEQRTKVVGRPPVHQTASVQDPTEHDNAYPLEYLEIQAIFARKMATLTGIPYHESLLLNTDLQGTLGLPWSVEPTNPVWQQFVGVLKEDGTGIEQAYQIYLQRHKEGLLPELSHNEEFWGCFGYGYDPRAKSVQVHFVHNDDSGYGPLSHQRMEVRLAELRDMFTAIREVHPEAELVTGGSWLLCRTAYSRLFPPKQNATDYPAELKLGAGRRPGQYLWGTGVWGQFLRHGNSLNEKAAAEFLQRLDQLDDVKDFAECFPSALILTNGPISNFYEFYGVS